jgi:hypothetical protein
MPIRISLVRVSLILLWLGAIASCSAQKEQSTEKSEQESMDYHLRQAQKVATCADRLEITLIDVKDRSYRRFGPFVTDDEALLKEIRRCLAKPQRVEKNPFRHSRPLAGNYLEITMVCAGGEPKREYRLGILADSVIALGDAEYCRIMQDDCRIWSEAFRLTDGVESIPWNNDSL